MFVNHGDICNIKGNSVEQVDCIIGGSPCFPKDTLVLTENGYKPIQDIMVGDNVYTHKNRLRTVVSVGSKLGDLVKLKGNLSEFLCTREHPIYTHDVSLLWQYNNRSYKRGVTSDEKWIPAIDMLGKYWETPNAFACEIESPIQLTQELCYFFGRWIGDGWCRTGKRSGRKNGTIAEILLCDSLDKELELIKTVNCVTKKFSIERKKSCVKIKFHNRFLCDILEKNFGHGAYNKTIPAFLLGSSEKCRISLLKGLTDSDGYIVNDHKITYTSVSKSLIFSIRLLAESLGFSTSIFFNECSGCSIVDGRKVKRTPIWSCSIVKSKKVGRLTYENHSLYKVRKVSTCGESKVTVYNLEVDEDNSYIADSIIVHNCQDLSIAGSKQGLSGSQSRLFLEQMRVVEEMRVSSNGKKPRYMVWENVTNSLSCNKGKDFQHVLKECINVAVRTSFCLEQKERKYTENSQTTRDKRQQSIPDVPMPKNGKWAKSGILYDDLGRWSIAWRIHDAQYWGVAQRRRRIALVVDFGGLTAPEVLFEQQSMSGNFNQSNAQREGTSTSSDRSPSKSDYVWDARGNGSGNLCSTLTGDHDNRITDYTNVVVEKNEQSCEIYSSFCIKGDAHESGLSCIEENSLTLKVYSVNENVRNELRLSDTTYPITCGGVKLGQSYPCICIGNGQSHVTEHYTEELSQTLNCMHDPMTILEPRIYQLVGVNSNSNPNSGCYETQQTGTITTSGCVPNNQGGTAIVDDSNFTYKVRRLTPLECTRLQGFPDGWVDIGDWVDTKGKLHKDADAPKYKALGNSIALPFWKWLCKNIVNKIKEKNDYNYIPTMASLFAGIGGFDLCWYEATGTKESIKWVSEIEEFPIAVLKNHF